MARIAVHGGNRARYTTRLQAKASPRHRTTVNQYCIKPIRLSRKGHQNSSKSPVAGALCSLGLGNWHYMKQGSITAGASISSCKSKDMERQDHTPKEWASLTNKEHLKKKVSFPWSLYANISAPVKRQY